MLVTSGRHRSTEKKSNGNSQRSTAVAEAQISPGILPFQGSSNGSISMLLRPLLRRSLLWKKWFYEDKNTTIRWPLEWQYSRGNLSLGHCRGSLGISIRFFFWLTDGDH